MTHTAKSFLKSGIRIFGYLIIVMAGWRSGDALIAYGGLMLVGSEVVGIAEEM